MLTVFNGAFLAMAALDVEQLRLDIQTAKDLAPEFLEEDDLALLCEGDYKCMARSFRSEYIAGIPEHDQWGGVIVEYAKTKRYTALGRAGKPEEERT